MVTQNLTEYHKLFKKCHHGYFIIFDLLVVPVVMLCFFVLLNDVLLFRLTHNDEIVDVKLDSVLFIFYFLTYIFDLISGVPLTPILLMIYMHIYFFRTVSPYVDFRYVGLILDILCQLL
jgi:hypothetical protein